jgi:hypothetical protein
MVFCYESKQLAKPFSILFIAASRREAESEKGNRNPNLWTEGSSNGIFQ